MAKSAPTGMVHVQDLQPSIEGSSRNQRGRGERLASAMGGGLLSLRGLTKGSFSGLVLTALRSALLYGGVSAHWSLYERSGIDTSAMDETPAPDKVRVVALIIACPCDAVYMAWRKFENLPRFMRHLASVRRIGDRLYHWVARTRGLVIIECDAQVVEERENQLIAWQSLPGAQLSNAGW